MDNGKKLMRCNEQSSKMAGTNNMERSNVHSLVASLRDVLSTKKKEDNMEEENGEIVNQFLSQLLTQIDGMTTASLTPLMQQLNGMHGKDIHESRSTILNIVKETLEANLQNSNENEHSSIMHSLNEGKLNNNTNSNLISPSSLNCTTTSNINRSTCIISATSSNNISTPHNNNNNHNNINNNNNNNNNNNKHYPYQSFSKHYRLVTSIPTTIITTRTGNINVSNIPHPTNSLLSTDNKFINPKSFILPSTVSAGIVPAVTSVSATTKKSAKKFKYQMENKFVDYSYTKQAPPIDVIALILQQQQQQQQQQQHAQQSQLPGAVVNNPNIPHPFSPTLYRPPGLMPGPIPIRPMVTVPFGYDNPYYHQSVRMPKLATTATTLTQSFQQNGSKLPNFHNAVTSISPSVHTTITTITTTTINKNPDIKLRPMKMMDVNDFNRNVMNEHHHLKNVNHHQLSDNQNFPSNFTNKFSRSDNLKKKHIPTNHSIDTHFNTNIALIKQNNNNTVNNNLISHLTSSHISTSISSSTLPLSATSLTTGTPCTISKVYNQNYSNNIHKLENNVHIKKSMKNEMVKNRITSVPISITPTTASSISSLSSNNKSHNLSKRPQSSNKCSDRRNSFLSYLKMRNSLKKQLTQINDKLKSCQTEIKREKNNLLIMHQKKILPATKLIEKELLKDLGELPNNESKTYRSPLDYEVVKESLALHENIKDGLIRLMQERLNGMKSNNVNESKMNNTIMSSLNSIVIPSSKCDIISPTTSRTSTEHLIETIKNEIRHRTFISNRNHDGIITKQMKLSSKKEEDDCDNSFDSSIDEIEKRDEEKEVDETLHVFEEIFPEMSIGERRKEEPRTFVDNKYVEIPLLERWRRNEDLISLSDSELIYYNNDDGEMDENERKEKMKFFENKISRNDIESYRKRNDAEWPDKLKSLFLAKYLECPKQFHEISKFLRISDEYRSRADCVDYYYRTKTDSQYKDLLTKPPVTFTARRSRRQTKKTEQRSSTFSVPQQHNHHHHHQEHQEQQQQRVQQNNSVDNNNKNNNKENNNSSSSSSNANLTIPC
ncbi:hypothetical protein SNEBB_007156 [Seison nebaliae]|nr:hypothetical protein SNEBB_007156 [Seison nebaliae]